MALFEMFQRHWWILLITIPGLAFITVALSRKLSRTEEKKTADPYSEAMGYIAKVSVGKFFGPAFLVLGILGLIGAIMKPSSRVDNMFIRGLCCGAWLSAGAAYIGRYRFAKKISLLLKGTDQKNTN